MEKAKEKLRMPHFKGSRGLAREVEKEIRCSTKLMTVCGESCDVRGMTVNS